MSPSFHACPLPWQIWPWGLQLTHADTDTLPECSVEFGAMIVRPTGPYEQFWVRVDFELAAFASAKPRRDDEPLADVTGYDIVPRRRVHDAGDRDAEWLRSGTCPDPGVYFSTDSALLAASRVPWSERQRTNKPPEAAVHFLLDGRDAYLEILAAGFSWRAWHQGDPILSEVSGEPIMRGEWSAP